MRHFFLAVLLFCALGGNANAQEDANLVRELPSGSERWALVVGIGKYEDPDLNKLFGPNDAATLARDLERYAGFPHDHIIVLSDHEPPSRQPKRERILYWLSNVKRNATAKSLILFAFSGHGISVGGESYLMAIDTYLSSDPVYLTKNAVSSTDISNSLRESKATQVILLLDACRNNPYSSKGDSRNPLTQQFANSFDFTKVNIGKQVSATIFATSIGFEAFQYQDAKMGYFTWVLDQALQGKPYVWDNGKLEPYDSQGRMTLARLVKYVEDRTPIIVKVDYPDRSQVPYVKIEGVDPGGVIVATIGKQIEIGDTNTKPSTSPASRPYPAGMEFNAKVKLECSGWDGGVPIQYEKTVPATLRFAADGKFESIAQDCYGAASDGSGTWKRIGSLVAVQFTIKNDKRSFVCEVAKNALSCRNLATLVFKPE